MRRFFHEFLTNKTEQIHLLVTNVFLPKRSFYCHTICGRARTSLAVSIDSLGYYKNNRQLYLKLGLELSSITQAFYKQQDKRKTTNQVYAKKPERRKLQEQQSLANINKELQKEVVNKQNGNTYQSAIMMAPTIAAPLSLETQSSSKGPVDNGKRDDWGDHPFCKACKNMDINEDPAGCV
jgi:hypothetical protein